MSTRISSLLLLSLLAACGSEQAQQAPAKPAPVAETAWCAIGGAKDFGRDCTIERGELDGQPAFVVRHPDGKFRRLVASADAQQLQAADGAEVTQSARKSDERGERWEVILGDDRYVIPVKADAPRP